MSATGKGRIRQPGRTAQGHSPPDCGACDSHGKPLTLALVLSGFDGCCNGGIDVDQAHAYILTQDTANCDRSKSADAASRFCVYSKTLTVCNGFWEFIVTIQCRDDGDGLRVHYTFLCNEVDSAGNLIAEQFTGDWESDIVTECGKFNCLDPKKGGASVIPGGPVTFQNSNLCFAVDSVGATWSAAPAEADPCPQPAHKNCCCGGKPPPPCLYICILGCGFDGLAIPVCRRAGETKFEGQIAHGDGVIAVTLEYDNGWKVSWSCDGWATSQTHTFSSASNLSGNDSGIPSDSNCCTGGGPLQLLIGRSPPCAPPTSDCLGACKDNTLPSEIFADLGGGTWENGTCGCCGAIGGVFGMDKFDATLLVSGYCPSNINNGCYASYSDLEFCPNALCGPSCNDFWRMGMAARICPVDADTWRWTFEVFIFMPGTSDNSTLCPFCLSSGAAYVGPIMNNGDSCALDPPVTLVAVPQGAPVPLAACIGSPPATVTLFSPAP